MSDALHKNWPVLRDKLRQLFPVLTEEDLSYEPGHEEELYERLQIRLGRTKAQVNEVIDGLATTRTEP